MSAPVVAPRGRDTDPFSSVSVQFVQRPDGKWLRYGKNGARWTSHFCEATAFNNYETVRMALNSTGEHRWTNKLFLHERPVYNPANPDAFSSVLLRVARRLRMAARAERLRDALYDSTDDLDSPEAETAYRLDTLAYRLRLRAQALVATLDNHEPGSAP